MAKHKFTSIAVVALMGDGEAFRLATQIRNFLAEQHYNVKTAVDQALWGTPPQGVLVGPAKENGELQIIVGSR